MKPAEATKAISQWLVACRLKLNNVDPGLLLVFGLVTTIDMVKTKKYIDLRTPDVQCLCQLIAVLMKLNLQNLIGTGKNKTKATVISMSFSVTMSHNIQSKCMSNRKKKFLNVKDTFHGPQNFKPARGALLFFHW